MRRLVSIFAALALLGAPPTADAIVVRPAADFEWIDYNGKASTLRALRGQPVVLLIAPSPRDRTFRAQVRQLQKAYQRFAAAKLVCFAAFTEEEGTIESNIPFVVVPDGPRVAFLYDVPSGFSLAIIGPDGNVDSLGTRVMPAQRLLDIMDGNYAVQRELRIDQERAPVAIDVEAE